MIAQAPATLPDSITRLQVGDLLLRVEVGVLDDDLVALALAVAR